MYAYLQLALYSELERIVLLPSISMTLAVSGGQERIHTSR